MRDAQTISFETRLSLLFEQRAKRLWVIALLLLPGGLIYLLRLNQVVGLGGDDAWYILLAKSLSIGQGYHLINSPVSGILPLYPPAFPALLSILLRFLPMGAENLWLLKWVSVIAMLGLGVGVFRYTVHVRQLPVQIAALVTMVVVWMPAFVFLATATVMSECIFALAQLLTVIATEKLLRRKHQPAAWYWWIGVGLLAGWAFLTRSIAIGLLIAIGLYLLKERNYKAAVVFTISTLLFIAPWIVHTRVNTASTELKRIHGGNIVYTYGEQVWMKRAGVSDSGTETVSDFPPRIGRNILNIVMRDVCGMVFPSLLRSPQESGEEVFSLGESETLGGGNMSGNTATTIVSVSLCLLALLGFLVAACRRITLAEILMPCSFAVIVIWPWWTFRFVLPLAPFLLYYILIGLTTLASSASQLLRHAKVADEWAVPRIFMFCVLALYGYDHFAYIRGQLQNTKSSEWITEYNESLEVMQWMRTHLPPDSIVASNNPAFVFLYSERKAISCERPLENAEQWKQIGVRYMVVLESHGRTLLDGQEQKYPVLYRSMNNMRVVDLGASNSPSLPK
jgi:hypothetical protein